MQESALAVSRSKTVGKSYAWRWLDHSTAPPVHVSIQARSLRLRLQLPQTSAHGRLRGADIGEESSTTAEERVRTA